MWVADSVGDCIGGFFVTFYARDDRNCTHAWIQKQDPIVNRIHTRESDPIPIIPSTPTTDSPTHPIIHVHPYRDCYIDRGLEFTRCGLPIAGLIGSLVGGFVLGIMLVDLCPGSGISCGGFEHKSDFRYNLRIYNSFYNDRQDFKVKC